MSANPYDEIVAKAWADDWFKKRFLADPESIFREHGIEVPAGIHVRVVEDTPTERHVVLPPKPAVPAVAAVAATVPPASPRRIHFTGWTNTFAGGSGASKP